MRSSVAASSSSVVFSTYRMSCEKHMKAPLAPSEKRSRVVRLSE